MAASARASGSSSRSASSVSFWLRIAAIAFGIAAVAFKPSSSWVERAYVNGAYPLWEHALYALNSPLPWSLGDIVVLAGLAAIAWRLVRRDWLGAIAIVALYLGWFEAGWGWNYDRAPIEARTAYDQSRITPSAVDALRDRVIANINRLAPRAHALASEPLDIGALRAAWLPVVRAGGDDWVPETGAPKPTLADAFMDATGTSGYINPLALDAHLASDLFWFERPFALAHEWSHIAGYAREDEANFLAIVSCTRSNDPVVQYSGWLELFLYLPPQARYPKKTFVPQVWQDFAAMRERNRRHINVSLANFSWRTYNTYLKSNHIASGVKSYDEVTRLYLGIPRDTAGIPMPRIPGGSR
ncbi:MAG TPA: DUF3810 family protein [Candidatus Baltobacteraceae bacterium]|nr:DUF3810 family protein [Candidatus Baltobacteraceae bacterium]